MSKRSASQTRGPEDAPMKQGERPERPEEDEAGPFEDDQEDEFEDEIIEIGEDGQIAMAGAEDDSDDDAEAMDVDSKTQSGQQSQNQTFIPGRNTLEKGQILEPDESAYEMLHRLEPPWPCLSFDIIRDHLGSGKTRKKYPATVYAVAGTQAAQGHDKENELLVMKLSKLSRNEQLETDSESDEESDDDETSDPILETKRIKLTATTNRIRARQLSETESASSSSLSQPGNFPTTFAASMSESGLVYIHNITPHLIAFDTPGTVITPEQNKPVHTIKAHGRNEGYALSWSPPHASHAGKLHLLTGDTAGKIYLTTGTPSTGGNYTWQTSEKPFLGHTSSVEDLAWSPSEPTVFASASADCSVRVWDTRSKARKPQLSVKVAETDVNVIAWSALTPNLLASGHDDGSWAVWDLREWKPAGNPAGGAGANGAANGTSSSLPAGVPKPPPGFATPGAPVARYAFNKEQITSLRWHPTDDSVISVCAGDNTLTLWDLAVEFDDEESKDTADAKDVPAALLFVHYSEGVKESAWHGQQEGVVMCTGASGFGVLRTISV